MKKDYNLFTKKELVDFLNEHEGQFTCFQTPFMVLIQKKIDETLNEMNVCNHAASLLDLDNIEEYIKINKRWEKLQKQFDSLEKIAYGKE